MRNAAAACPACSLLKHKMLFGSDFPLILKGNAAKLLGLASQGDDSFY